MSRSQLNDSSVSSHVNSRINSSSLNQQVSGISSEDRINKLSETVERMQAELNKLKKADTNLRLEKLEAENAQLNEENAQLKAENAQLKAEIPTLKAKSSTNNQPKESLMSPKSTRSEIMVFFILLLICFIKRKEKLWFIIND